MNNILEAFPSDISGMIGIIFTFKNVKEAENGIEKYEFLANVNFSVYKMEKGFGSKSTLIYFGSILHS